jgi:carboxypeptidase PM20D1
VAEKGYLSLKLEAKATPGHSSMPPAPGQSAIAQLSRALERLDAQPMPAAVSGVAAEMFETLAPEMSGFMRVALTNRWLFGPLVQGQLEKSAGSTNERISLANLGDLIRFYQRLLQTSAGTPSSEGAKP